MREVAEKEDDAKCESMNDEWNASIAKSREIRLAKEREARREFILQRIVDKEERDRRYLAKIEEQVRRVKEESVTFITEKNIDQAIEDALDNPVDHNWAIDENGIVHRGKYVQPEGDDNRKQKRAQRN